MPLDVESGDARAGLERSFTALSRHVERIAYLGLSVTAHRGN